MITQLGFTTMVDVLKEKFPNAIKLENGNYQITKEDGTVVEVDFPQAIELVK